MFCFQRYTRLLLRLMSSPQGLKQSLRLGLNPIYSAVPSFPHDNLVGNRLCHECKKWILLVVYHISESTLWLIVQACWSIIECQVVQFVPSISISRQFESKLLTILQLIRVLPAWIDGHPSKDLKLCNVAPPSCLPVHSFAQRIFEHVLPCRKTTLQFSCEAFHNQVIFSVAPAEIRDSNIFVYCSIIQQKFVTQSLELPVARALLFAIGSNLWRDLRETVFYSDASSRRSSFSSPLLARGRR